MLKDTCRAKLTQGRFISSDDAGDAANVVVLDETIASKLFATDKNPIGVDVDGVSLTIIGVVTCGHASLTDNVTRDGYVPLDVSDTLVKTRDELDRIRVRVDSIDQRKDAKTIIQTLMKRRHDTGVIVK